MSTLAVVGAGRLLGRSVALRFAAEGFDVALLSRRPQTLEPVLAELEQAGVRAEAFAADVTDRPALPRALAAAEERLGTIDALQYSPAPSAADLAAHPIVEASRVTVESLLPGLELFVFGGVTAVQAVLPGMLARGRGTVLVTTGAGSGPMTIPEVSNLQVATAGLRRWALDLHASVADRGVYVAHVAIAAAIGDGRPASEPDVIAEALWQLHRERTEPELYYRDLPEAYEFEGLAERYQHDA